MKKKIIILIVFILAMTCVPVVTSGIGARRTVPTANTAAVPDKAQRITEAACALYRKKYSGKTLNLLAIILNSNYSADNKRFSELKRMDKDKFIQKYGRDNYSKIENKVKNYSSARVTYKGENVFVPVFRLSNGYTIKNKSVPWLDACACPWDMLEKGYEDVGNVHGVSVNTLNRLIKLGLSKKNALRWFGKLEIES